MKRLNGGIILTEVFPSLILAMWMYAAITKLWDIDKARGEMLNQVFPAPMAEVLVWAVPAAELLTAGLLFYPKTRRAGLLASLFLLFQFTVYISIVMTGIVGWIPCSCGGVLEQMTWGQHLVFNLLFLGLTLVAIFFSSQSSQSETFGGKQDPHSPSSRDHLSSDIRPGYGKNGVEKLPRIRAPDGKNLG